MDGKPARQRVLRSSLWYTVPGAHLLVGVPYGLLPPLPHLASAVDRLVFSLQWLPVAVLPYAAVCAWILYARFEEGSHNPLAGAESETLRLHCRVMQNTLEQLVWFALCVLPFATLVSAEQVRVVPVLCVYFAAVRFLYWWGYLRNGTLGRAPAVQLTFLLNIPLLAVTLALLLRA